MGSRAATAWEVESRQSHRRQAGSRSPARDVSGDYLTSKRPEAVTNSTLHTSDPNTHPALHWSPSQPMLPEVSAGLLNNGLSTTPPGLRNSPHERHANTEVKAEQGPGTLLH